MGTSSHAAQLIIDGCGWRDEAHTLGALEQVRIVHEGAGRYIGVTGDQTHGSVSLHAGRIRPDGSFEDAVAHSGAVYGTDLFGLVTTAMRLWRRLDNDA